MNVIEEAFKKTCAHCGERKSATEFHRKAEMPDGRRGICRVCIAEKARRYRLDNPEVVAASKRRWAERNPESGREAARRYRQDDRRGGDGGITRIRRQNPEAYASLQAKWAKRRADRLRATPSWHDPVKVRSLYLQAGRMRRAGHDVHVDHVIPLRGKFVCGLHVHNNLRIIPATENIAKGAKLIQALASHSEA